MRGSFGLAACVLFAACGTDKSPTTATATNSPIASEPDATTLCDEHRPPDAGSGRVAIASTLPAAVVVQIYVTSGLDPGVWATVASDRNVTQCTYGDLVSSGIATTTTVCPDGRTVASTADRLPSFFVDDYGNTTHAIELRPGVTI
ncbi:MAG: hypothetical protein QOG30_3189, partial [Acidimicrobiaceae bacterium]